MNLPPTAAKHRLILRTPVIGAVAVVVWLVSAIYLWHFGHYWHLDLRVHRAAGRSLLDHGAPFKALFTANRLPFTYPPFALLALNPLAFGSLDFVEGAWWVANSLALVATLYLLVPIEPGVGKRWRLAVASLLGGVATLAIEPVRSNMDYGQINLLLMLLVVVDLDRYWWGVQRGIGGFVTNNSLLLIGALGLLAFAVSFRQGELISLLGRIGGKHTGRHEANPESRATR